MLCSATTYIRRCTIHAIHLPPRIETERLVLRCYEPGDVKHLDGAAIHSIDHIGRFLPHARAELLGDRSALLADAIRGFETGERFAYGMFLHSGAYVGNCGARWVGERELNIGYWILVEHLRQGYTTEAVRAVTTAGFSAGVSRFVLNCDPANTASIGVARSAGFVYLSTDERTDANGTPFVEMTWELLPDHATGA